MDRKGLTAIVDAMFFIVLIGVATVMVALFMSSGDGGTEDPSTVCTNLFGSYVDADDLGYGHMEMGVCSIAEFTASSVLLGDGVMERYLQGFLDTVYPWTGAYLLELKVDGKKVTVGNGCGSAVAGYTCMYPVWYSTVLEVTLQVY